MTFSHLPIAAAVVFFITPTITLATDANEIKAGKKLAEKLCSKCHAVTPGRKSPMAKAPTFKAIANRYSVWSLQEALAEGIVTGHPGMPQFIFGPTEIDDLLGYWDTMTVKKPK